METYKATIDFNYTPITTGVFNVEEITEAASDYLTLMINDFFGFGVKSEKCLPKGLPIHRLLPNCHGLLGRGS